MHDTVCTYIRIILPHLLVSFWIVMYGEKQQKMLEHLIYFMEGFEISTIECVLIFLSISCNLFQCGMEKTTKKKRLNIRFISWKVMKFQPWSVCWYSIAWQDVKWKPFIEGLQEADTHRYTNRDMCWWTLHFFPDDYTMWKIAIFFSNELHFKF